jgi:hypothetical protein
MSADSLRMLFLEMTRLPDASRKEGISRGGWELQSYLEIYL